MPFVGNDHSSSPLPNAILQPPTDAGVAVIPSPLPASVKHHADPRWLVSTTDAAYHFGTSGLSVAVATGFTHPLDVLKVRLQMQLVGQRGPLTGMGQILANVVKEEGPRFLYLGLMPALTRSILYGGLRLGLYEPTKHFCEMECGLTNVFVKLASGAFSGAIATALTNPVEDVKVRLQMNLDLRKGGPIAEVRKIVSEEGVKALWKGVGPAMARAAALTASQLATYDESKQILLRWTSLEEGINLHFVSSAIAGGVSTLMTAPMDMVKTRLMLQVESKSIAKYRNGFCCAYQVFLTEGPKALYKGGFGDFCEIRSANHDYLHTLRKTEGGGRIEGNLAIIIHGNNTSMTILRDR